MSRVLDDLLTQLGVHPVLVDVGASGEPPAIWDEIAAQSIYVGFDPDRRELHDVSEGKFFRSIIVNKALIHTEGSGEVSFYLTKSPGCSSTLKPDSESLSNYLFSELFAVEQQATVPATTLNLVMESLSLSRIHWFKTDSQGIDLRLFNSIPEQVRSGVLAIDIEPGLIDAYMGEDLFADVHRDLVRNGFWLSDLNVKGSVRMRRSTLREVMAFDKGIDGNLVRRVVRKSPGWCEARYLRTIESLNQGSSAKDDYVLLWIFALMDDQPSFALDVAVEYEEAFGRDHISHVMKDEPIRRIIEAGQRTPQQRKWLTKFKATIPLQVRRWLGTHMRGMF